MRGLVRRSTARVAAGTLPTVAVLVTAFHPSSLAKMMAAAALAGLAVTVVVYLIGSVIVHGHQIVTVRSGPSRTRDGESSAEEVPR